MATITLRPEVYDKASIFAKKDKLNVDEWVNNVLQKIVMEAPKEKAKEKSAELKMFSWKELAGIFSSDKSDRELQDEYLKEKYGI